MSGVSVRPSFANAAASKAKRKRPAPLSVRLSPEEKARLKREAGDGTLHALARERLLGPRAARKGTGSSLSQIDRIALAKALAALGSSHLASNMNQLAKATNRGALPLSDGLIRELHAACADIRTMRIALTEALGVKAKG